MEKFMTYGLMGLVVAVLGFALLVFMGKILNHIICKLWDDHHEERKNLKKQRRNIIKQVYSTKSRKRALSPTKLMQV